MTRRTWKDGCSVESRAHGPSAAVGLGFGGNVGTAAPGRCLGQVWEHLAPTAEKLGALLAAPGTETGRMGSSVAPKAKEASERLRPCTVEL